MEAEGTELTTFSDGMRLVTRHVPNRKRTKMRVRLDAGSRDEIFGHHKRGTSHGLEHDLFKGSRDHPQPSQVSQRIKEAKGTLKASTDFDAIVLDLEVPKDALPAAMHVAGDMVSNPLFMARPWALEKRRIDKEWLEGVMDPFKERFLDTVYVSSGKSGLLHPVIGTRQSIASLQVDDLARFYREKVTAGNVVIAVEGDIADHDVVGYMRRCFELPPGIRPWMETPRYIGGDRRTPDTGPGTRVMVGLPMPPRADVEASAPFLMLSTILGGNSSNSFFDQMSEKEGLVYAVEVQRRPFADYGLFTIGFVSNPWDVRRNLELIAAQIVRASESIDPETLEFHKEINRDLRADKLNEFTVGVDNLADNVAIHGRVLPRDYSFNLQDALSVEDVRNAASTLVRSMREHPPTFVASGHVRHLPRPKEVVKIFQEAAEKAGKISEIRTPLRGAISCPMPQNACAAGD